jgi:hypothetical protein
MDVKDNHAYNQQIIQNAIIYGGTSFGGYNLREVAISGGKVDKEYDLSNSDDFAEFGEIYRASEYFATAVVLCVFECVGLDDLQHLKSKLLDELPCIKDEEGNALQSNKHIQG